MNKDRIEGSIDQAKGKAKETVGKATGNAKLEGEGKVDQVAGKAQETYGKGKEAAQDAVKDAADKVKESVDR